MNKDDLIELIRARHANTAMAALGIDFVDFNTDAVAAEAAVTEKLFQHAGVVHGGVYVLMAESVASTAAALFVEDMLKFVVSGQEINANHLRSVSEGRLRAVATPIHRGKTTHVYGIDITDDKERLVSVSRCTMAIRPRR